MKSEEELRKEFEDKLKELELQRRIAAEISEEVGKFRIHVYPLNGQIGSVTFEQTSEGRRHSARSARGIHSRFPAVPMVLDSTSGKSFVTREYAEDSKAAKDRITPCAPFFLRADFSCVAPHGHTPSLELTWHTLIAGHPVEIQCLLEPYPVLAWSFDSLDRTNEHARILKTNLKFSQAWGAWGEVPVVYDKEGKTSAMRVITWGRGSDIYGHQFTFYSEDPGLLLDDHLSWLIANGG